MIASLISDMEQPQAVARTNAQWFMTTQGATVSGIEPEGGERQSWRFTVLLRDLVYGLPSGVNHQEWREWVDQIYTCWMVSGPSVSRAPN